MINLALWNKKKLHKSAHNNNNISHELWGPLEAMKTSKEKNDRKGAILANIDCTLKIKSVCGLEIYTTHDSRVSKLSLCDGFAVYSFDIHCAIVYWVM